MVGFLLVDPMVSGSNPPSATLSLGMRRLALSNSRSRNHQVWSHREEGPGRFSIGKKLLRVQISVFDIYVESYV